MSRRLRIITATALLALATPYVAGILALGYGFNEKARSGLLYHWLYAVPELLPQYAGPGREAVWLLALAAIYALQYLSLFALLTYGMLLLSRGVRIVLPSSSEPTARLIAWVFAAATLLVVLWLLGGAPLPLAALASAILTWVCIPSLNARPPRDQYATNGT